MAARPLFHGLSKSVLGTASISLALVLGLALPLNSGCQFSEKRRLHRDMVANELTGTWRLTATGVDGLRAGGHEVNPADHRLVLRADGSCTLSMFKESCVEPGRPDPGMISSAEPCRWRLYQAGGDHEVVFDLGAQRRVLTITEEEGKLLIFEIVCDPDSWKYAEYEKGGGA